MNGWLEQANALIERTLSGKNEIGNGKRRYRQ
jgi:hypothetical protein